MKKLVFTIMALLSAYFTSGAQGKTTTDALQNAVTKLDRATKARDYESLQKEFLSIAEQDKKNWLPYYYAAFCNAKTGFFLQDDGDGVEPFSNRGEDQAKKAKALLDTVGQKKELSEVYTVLSMVYRTKVFINPMTYGRKYGKLSQEYRIKAQALNPQNPRAIYVKAWEMYNTPKLWGGNKELGKQLAEQSLGLLKDPETGVYPHWGKAESQELLSKNK
ncbi:hypothetical protein [Pedobacter caeni]|uniref:Uncharacterized protein n=1 Tax=Pedobacter caeni TaxID=288992 RepID=A0A1M5J244_9SPHI|nr:hypothetical protein [Pedobacter caeni]SHG34667.1 hypothetical protein SAMN04488522_105166 [Pedobacter caeni]